VHNAILCGTAKPRPKHGVAYHQIERIAPDISHIFIKSHHPVHDVSRARFRHSFLKGPADLFGYTLSLRNVLLDDFISQLDTLRDDIIE
jgi:hypothetical protein